MLIAVDGGKDTTKSCTSDKSNSFRSRIYDVTKFGDRMPGGNTHRVLFEGNEYLIGDSGTEQNYSTSKTDIYNKLCQYVAITRYIEPGATEKVELITGIPASLYKNEKGKEEYINNIRGNGKVSITVDEKNYSFEFIKIKVMPESSGISILQPELFEDRNVIVIDIGGQNLNIGVFEDLVPSDTMITENSGGTNLEETIRNSLASKGVENLTESLIRNMILTNTNSVDIEVNRYIEENIVRVLDRNNINYNLMDVIFIGGTSFILKDYLKEYFKDATFMTSLEESQFSNVKGFYKLGEMLSE